MIRFLKISKSYGARVVLNDLDFEIQDGEFVYLMGPSGGGKTTIFKLIELIERPDKGEIWLDDNNIVTLNDSYIPQLRRQVGVVFQDYKLIGSKTVFENISLALELLGGYNKNSIKEVVESALDVVNLKGFERMFPSQLSGGEKQRVAIARAIITNPSVLLADEPTGNLDATSAKEILLILKKISERGTTIMMATHDENIVKAFPKRVIRINLKTENGGREDFDKKDEIKIINKKIQNLVDLDTKISHTDGAEVNSKTTSNLENKKEEIKNIKEKGLLKEEQEAPLIVKRKGFFSRFKSPFKSTNSDIGEAKKVANVTPEKTLNFNKDIGNKEWSRDDSSSDVDSSGLQIQDLNLSREIILALEKRGIDRVDEIKDMTDATLSRIVGVINVWKVRQAIKTIKNK